MNRSDATDQTPGEPLAALIRAEQLRLAYGHLPLALLATVLNALALTALLWAHVRHAALLAWLSAILLLSIVRHAHGLAYRRPHLAPATAETRFRLGALAAGVLWGCVPLFLFPTGAFAYQAMETVVLAGISAGAAVTLSSHRQVLHAVLLLILVPLIGRLAMEAPQTLPLVLSGLGTLFLVMISAAAGMFHRNAIDSIRLGLEAQQRELALKQAEDQYRHLFEMANDAILIVDADGVILNANPVAYKRLGYERQEVLDMNLSRLLSPRDAAKRQDRVQRTLRLGSLSFEAEHVCKDGRLIPVEVSAQRIDYHGQMAVLSIARDISERKQAEEKLRTLSRALEQAGESVIITNDEGGIEYTNPAFTAMTGYGADEARGEDLGLLRMRDGRRAAALDRQMWSTARSGRVWQQELACRGKDGRTIPVLMSFSPIIDEDGRISHFVGIQKDITEHVELEDRLRQAQKMEAIGTLVGGIAHDFNNMLTGITGNLYLAKRQTQEMPEITEKLELSEKLAFSASKMVQQLLSFARKGEVEILPMELGRFIRETERLYALSMPDHIAYRSEIADRALPICGDDTQLQQVIINLLNNARDALAGTEQPCVTLRLEPFDASSQFRHRHGTAIRHFARITIEDNGPGIPDAIRSRIFEPFFTTKEAGSGTGLGLAMVYGTVTSHGGLIDVESGPAGTAFCIYLPLQNRPEQLPQVVNASESPVTGRGETLLVVDDDPQILEITRHLLEALGYRVLTAADGMEAIQVFSRHADDIKLVIMDLVMPRLGGARAYEQLHLLHEDVRVIFITSHDLKQRREIVPMQEKAVVLQKPWSATQLSQSVRRALDRTLH